MKLHRTKYSRLIEDVIAPSMYKDICEEMASQKYSIIVDESVRRFDQLVRRFMQKATLPGGTVLQQVGKKRSRLPFWA